MKKLIVVVLALAFCLAALPALAQEKPEYSFYGLARMFTSYESANDDTANRNAAAPIMGGTAGLPGTTANGFGAATIENQDDKDLYWGLQGTTQVGMRVKWAEFTGHVQLRESVSGDPGDYGATMAIFIGTWDFGAGTLAVGRDYSPASLLGVSNFCGPGAGDCGAVGYGLSYHYRVDQLKLIMGGFQFALTRPNRAGVLAWINDTGATPVRSLTPAVVDHDTKIPKIEASYTFNLGPAALAVAGWYNTQSVTFIDVDCTKDVDIKSWGLAATAKFAFGPLYFNVGGQWAQNVGYGNDASNLLNKYPMYYYAPVGADDLEDAKYIAAMGVLGFRVTTNFAVEAGILYQSGKEDIYGGGDIKESLTVYYLQAAWSPAKNITISPEFAIIDYGKLEITDSEDIDFGKLTYLGVKWQISF